MPRVGVPTTPPTPVHGIAVPSTHHDAAPPEWVKHIAERTNDEE
jgi:hypothetical protein